MSRYPPLLRHQRLFPGNPALICRRHRPSLASVKSTGIHLVLKECRKRRKSPGTTNWRKGTCLWAWQPSVLINVTLTNRLPLYAFFKRLINFSSLGSFLPPNYALSKILNNHRLYIRNHCKGCELSSSMIISQPERYSRRC